MSIMLKSSSPETSHVVIRSSCRERASTAHVARKGADYDPTDPVNKPGNRVYIQSLDDPTVYYVLQLGFVFVVEFRFFKEAPTLSARLDWAGLDWNGLIKHRPD